MKHCPLLPAICMLLSLAAHADELMDPALRQRASEAIDGGLRFLRQHQAENGSWSGSVGITGLALRAFLESPRGYDESDGAFITRPVAFILKNVRENGSISESNLNTSYNTAVAIYALKATGNSEYETVIRNAQRFLKEIQVDEGEGYSRDHRYYGGIGYGGDERPDLSNQYLALEALAKTNLASDDPLWERALVFISRSQNRSESNDQEWAGNDGGFTYMPGYSPHGGTGSYGSITHAGLISLLFAGVDRNDPRVRAAHDWIRANYTVDSNPGANEMQGYYYYLTAFSKSMKAFGETEIKDTQGVSHNWRNDLAARIVSLQDPDGSWVNHVSARWWENNADLCTARAAIALDQALAR